MENDSVRFSRAGDTFHYRWAARRCLRMISPKSRVSAIVIEGSMERKKAGEYVIDVAEYLEPSDGIPRQIAYFQLKHTTIRKEQPFNLSDLKGTIQGFAERYSELFCGAQTDSDLPKVTFAIVTNRPVSENFKRNISLIRGGRKPTGKFQKTLEEYTSLYGQDLENFCNMLEFADGEGDYDAQRYELHAEIQQLLAGTVDNPQIDTIIALVQSKVLPNSDGRIIREEIYQKFGVTSEKDLYPAQPEFEEIDNVIKRKQHKELLDYILHATVPVIFHAAGGVGKSVFARQMAQSLPEGSLGVVYDCFGGGGYRNRSELRHRHRDALIQIVNELASNGLCDPLISLSTALEDEIMKKFLSRIKASVESLRKTNASAVLSIFIDAADNAEMAAKEFGHPCFVRELLRESMPDGCRLVALCRTERIHLLQPQSIVTQKEIKPFSVEETIMHLKEHYPQVSVEDGQEFHRLTSGNPRVQANALSIGLDSVESTLLSLGPSGATVEEQIEQQLDAAVTNIREKLTDDYRDQVDAICTGLATLPPFIPLIVLAKAAGVDEAAVKSFVADMGRPLWLSDTSVQFRDEPTETWFRGRFSAQEDQISSYVSRLKPLAYENTYVAETLPSLLLGAQRYDELIDLAISDKFLPRDNPIDQRNVRVHRLQFAFKAALKQERYDDAIKLALRAGEEVAGDKRQIELLIKNVDLIAPLQNVHRVQEIAYRRLLGSSWDGSENVYSASLLSSVDDFKGEARGYFRSATNWLRLYYREHQNSHTTHQIGRVTDEDKVELTTAFFNLFGASQAVEFLESWTRPEVAYDIGQQFFRRLIDHENIHAIDEIALIGSENQYLMIALAQELLEVGKFPSTSSLERCLDLLASSHTRIQKPSYSYRDTTALGLVSFAEACATAKLSKEKILGVLRYYFPERASHFLTSDYQDNGRDSFLRAVALKSVLSGDLDPNFEELLPEESSQKKHNYSNRQNEREILGGLLPWYIVRARILNNSADSVFDEVDNASQRSQQARQQRWRDYDIIPQEISRIMFDILILDKNAKPSQVQKLYEDHIQGNNQILMQDRMRAVRAAFRLDHLAGIRTELEQNFAQRVEQATNEESETRAGWFIGLARAVLSVDQGDAAAYLDYAIEAVSKFGDEIVDRWEAVVSLANRSAENGDTPPEIAYRFIRCAELIGDNVAREKHFNRNEAIRTCVRLSPATALAGLSRWRDRDVGWFWKQLPALAAEIVRSESVPPSVGWSLSAFFNEYGLDDFASLCIDREVSKDNQRYILEKVIRDLRLSEASEPSWQTLKKIAQRHFLDNSELDKVISSIKAPLRKVDETIIDQNRNQNDQLDTEVSFWDEIFEGLELNSSLGICQAVQRFHESRFYESHTHYRSGEEFWKAVYRRLDECNVIKFLKGVVAAENIDLYNTRVALSSIPAAWRRKVGVKRIWASILEMVARRFAMQLTRHAELKYFIDGLNVDNHDLQLIRNGILEELADNSDLVDEGTFWGFVHIAAARVTPKQAQNLLDFALARFELHIDDNYSDGPWAEWLIPPSDLSLSFAGFVWSALGSPDSKIRWQAAHSVRRLAEAKCNSVLDSLISWMEIDEVGSFGSNKFPFYSLHARLYLLIALSRISLDIPQILSRHYKVFSQHALSNMPHILIQKFAAEIALNLEQACPGTYSKDIVEQLQSVGVSQLPVVELEGDKGGIQSYWHKQGEIDTSIEYYHGIDFESYWFEPLGKVFGITGDEVGDIATEIIVKEWGVKSSNYNNDPRRALWSSGRNQMSTYHSHGSFPRIENYSFYLSYHAMFVAASKLIERMSVIHIRDWYEEAWGEWLRRHLLTRRDGRWLADRLDPPPLLKRDWIEQMDNDGWRRDVHGNDFIDGILFERDEETWLNVFGFWSEGDSNRSESYNVASALVLPEGSQSLLYAMSTRKDPHGFELPDYNEEDMEIDLFPFGLRGWVWKEDGDRGLDESDPHASKIPFPPYQIGESIVESMGLSVDLEQRKWFLSNAEHESIHCEIWSANRSNDDEDPLRYGNRLSASLSFLQELCVTTGCEIIIEVQISRRYKIKPYMENEGGKYDYKPPINKVFILSGDGKFRDAETYYELR